MQLYETVKQTLAGAGVTIRLNAFTREVMISRPKDEVEHPITDMDRAYLTFLFAEARVKGMTTQIQGAAIDLVSSENQYHPVADYLAEVKWDGTPRIDRWLIDYMKADDTPYVRAVGRLVLVAAARRARRPGAKFDELLTLVGPEGIGKSSALAALSPNPKWFSDSLPLGADAKLTIEQTAGIWLCESAELVGSKRTLTADIKAFLSRQVDGPVRLAFGRSSISVPRQFIPIATTNESVFLQSMTGDRRFWPVNVRYADSEAIARDRDQLWAEAARVEAANTPIRLDPSLWDAAQAVQSQFRIEDPMETALTVQKLGLAVTLPDIFNRLDVRLTDRTPALAARIAGVMQKNGFRKRRKMVDGLQSTFYEWITPFDPEGFDHRKETAPPADDFVDEAQSEYDAETKLIEWQEEMAAKAEAGGE